MTTENTPPETEVKNPAALLAKNRELLAAVASLNTQLQAAHSALEAQTKRADTLGADLHETRVMRPWRAAIADLVGDKTARVMERCLSDFVDVVAGDDGSPVLVGKDGQPLTLKGGIPVPVTSDGVHEFVHQTAEAGGEDLRPILPRATGCGAIGNPGGRSSFATPKPKPEPAATAAPAFGLR